MYKYIATIFLGLLFGTVVTLSLFFVYNPNIIRENFLIINLSDFELGQYYFNSDDDPTGPYDLEKARYYFEAALKQDLQQKPLLWYQLGRINFIEGRFEDALYDFNQQVLYFDDFIPNVYYMSGLTYGYKARRDNSLKDWRLAEENFQKFITYAPSAPWPRVDLAWIYFSQGKFQEMKPILEEGLVYEPNNAWLLNMYGLAVMNTANEKTDAFQYFYKAQESASKLTVEDWGRIYPGNDPALWNFGLKEFRDLIDKNIALLE